MAITQYYFWKPKVLGDCGQGQGRQLIFAFIGDTMNSPINLNLTERYIMRLETDRLYIRNLTETDWREMKNIFVDFHNSKYSVYDLPFPTDDEGAKELTKGFAVNNLFFAVFLKESSDMIGYVCFHKDGDIYDLGYCFHSAYHSKGYAYESTRALVEYFATENSATCFTAGTALDNTPSCRLLEKLGFLCVSTETVSFNGEFSFQGGNFVLNVK